MSSNGKENDDDIEEGITSPLLRRPIAIQLASTTPNDTDNTPHSSSIHHQTTNVSSDHQITTTHTEATTTANNNTNIEGSSNHTSTNGIEYLDEHDDGPANDIIRFEDNTVNLSDNTIKLRLANKLRHTPTTSNTTTNTQTQDIINDNVYTQNNNNNTYDNNNAYTHAIINECSNSISEDYTMHDMDSSNTAICGDNNRASNTVYSNRDYDESRACDRISSVNNRRDTTTCDTTTTAAALVAATANDINNTMDADVNVASAFRTTEAYLVQSQVYDAIVTKPWYKQQRVQVIVCILVLIVAALSIAFGIIISKRSNGTIINPCFETFGELNLAVDQYINEQNCINDDKCQVGRTYGWPVSCCVISYAYRIDGDMCISHVKLIYLFLLRLYIP